MYIRKQGVRKRNNVEIKEYMRIAITTWFGGPNAGTFFQLYGLYSYLESRGHEVEVVNYTPIKKDLTKRGLWYFLSQPLALLKNRRQRQKASRRMAEINAKYEKEHGIRAERFKAFYGKMRFTDKVSSDSDFEKLNEKFDAFIVGSDQVWNPTSLNRRYLLDYAHSDKIKASYCPSVGTGCVMRHQLNVFKRYLQDFDYISTRERRLADLLNEELAQNVEHLLDPSMLILREDYLAMASLPQGFASNGYVLCYFMPRSEKQEAQVVAYAKERGLKIVVMAMLYREYGFADAVIYPQAGPSEFIGFIANAAAIFTSSFHCTIFSILLNKDLFVFEGNATSKSADISQRYREQLETYDMMHRFIRWNEDITEKNLKPIDYNKVNEIFNRRLEESKSFLNQFC